MNTKASYGKDMHFFGISIINGRICMGFVADISNSLILYSFLFHSTVIKDP